MYRYMDRPYMFEYVHVDIKSHRYIETCRGLRGWIAFVVAMGEFDISLYISTPHGSSLSRTDGLLHIYIYIFIYIFMQKAAWKEWKAHRDSTSNKGQQDDTEFKHDDRAMVKELVRLAKLT